jgi:hypothetical protein
MSTDTDALFEDAEGDPHWQRAKLMADAPPRPAKGYVTYSLTWLARVLPIVRTPEQLAIAQLLYRQCLVQRSRTVALSNHELRKLGISRYAKYRALGLLQEVGAVTIEPRHGRSIQVTLHWFP